MSREKFKGSLLSTLSSDVRCLFYKILDDDTKLNFLLTYNIDMPLSFINSLIEKLEDIFSSKLTPKLSMDDTLVKVCFPLYLKGFNTLSLTLCTS